MKTNTNLAMIKLDLAYVEMTLAGLSNVRDQLAHQCEWSEGQTYDGRFVTAYYRIDDAIRHLKGGISEMKLLIRKKKYAAIKKSGGGARATNRTITGIG